MPSSGLLWPSGTKSGHHLHVLSCAHDPSLKLAIQVKQREAAFAASGEKEAARAVSRSCDDYLRQMGYREYSRYLSFHFPFTHERSLLEHLRACPWKWNQSHFKVCHQLPRRLPLA